MITTRTETDITYAFHSVAEFVAHSHASTRDGVSWCGGSLADIQRRAIYGDANAVPEIETLLDRFEHVTMPMTVARRRQSDVWGPRLHLADWLTESPTPFRRARPTLTESAPLRVFVSISCAAMLGTAELNARGAAIAALIETLQRVRPVELVLFHCCQQRATPRHTLTITVPVATAPIGLAQLAGVLCNVGLNRAIAMPWFDSTYLATRMTKPPTFVPVIGGDYASDHPDALNGFRRVLHTEPYDVIIPRSDMTSKIIRDPIAWLINELTRTMEYAQ